jgi:D-amino peptidase
VQRTTARAVTVSDDDPLRLYRTFVTIVQLTRAIVDG